MTEHTDKLQAIRQNYIAGLEPKLNQLTTAYRAIDVLNWSPESLEPLLFQLHSVSGSAGTFGLHGLSSAASRLEKQLLGLRDTGRPPAQVVWERIGQDIKRLASLAAVSSPRRPEAHQEKKPAPAKNGMHIDLVEDNAEEAEFLAEILQKSGYTVTIYANAESYQTALESSDVQPPAAVIVDIVLPSGRLAGADLVRAARKKGTDVPVVCISHRDDMEARLAAFEAGAVRYLAKPLDPVHLVGLLDALTGRQPEEPYRILMIDDDPELLAAQAEMLRTAGMNVLTTINPLETLDLLKLFQPDVLLMDVYMPEVTGPEVAAIIRDSDDYLNLPILFLSAEENLDQQLMALSLGGDDFLVKPLREDHLRKAVIARARRSRQNALVIDHLEQVLNEYDCLRHAWEQNFIMAVADEQGLIIDCNHHFERASGRALEEIKDIPFLSPRLFEETATEMKEMTEVLETDDVWQGPLHFHRTGERLGRITATIIPLRKEKGLPPYQYWFLGTGF